MTNSQIDRHICKKTSTNSQIDRHIRNKTSTNKQFQGRFIHTHYRGKTHTQQHKNTKTHRLTGKVRIMSTGKANAIYKAVDMFLCFLGVLRQP